MEITKDMLIIYIILIVGGFYYLISENKKEIERRDVIITEQHETMDLQTQAIDAQARQVYFLQQYYNQTQRQLSPITPQPGPSYQ